MLKRFTPIKRAPLVRKQPDKATLVIRPGKAKCKHCGTKFERLDPRRTWCSPECGSQIAIAKIVKQADENRKAAHRADRAKREALKPLSKLRAEAQAAFNAFIRARDKAAGHPCICCGQPLDWGAVGVRGHAVDAGHYRSTGSAPNVRFDERNVHAQRVVCNRHGAGRAVDYRIGLVRRIGLEAVEALESDNTPRRYRAEDYRRIKAEYSAKLKDFMASIASHDQPPDSGAGLGARAI